MSIYGLKGSGHFYWYTQLKEGFPGQLFFNVLFVFFVGVGEVKVSHTECKKIYVVV
jgi:hypothetical protein